MLSAFALNFDYHEITLIFSRPLFSFVRSRFYLDVLKEKLKIKRFTKYGPNGSEGTKIT
jgi:hypothetical protein